MFHPDTLKRRNKTRLLPRAAVTAQLNKLQTAFSESQNMLQLLQTTSPGKVMELHYSKRCALIDGGAEPCCPLEYQIITSLFGELRFPGTGSEFWASVADWLPGLRSPVWCEWNLCSFIFYLWDKQNKCGFFFFFLFKMKTPPLDACTDHAGCWEDKVKYSNIMSRSKG